MKQGQEKSEVSKRILSIMHRNARRLQNLINQLLDISRIESGKMELRLNKANLSEFVRVVASSFYSLSESRRIQFQIDIDPDNEDSCFDADKTEKVITNLVSNAFKFCDEGGSVSLQLEFVNPVDEDQRLAIIKVIDTGQGIEKEQLEKIFDRFYQVSDNDTREVEGSGIGLALTKELVELMHGSIEVESTPGKGTSFQVIFPVSERSFSEQEIKAMIEGIPSFDFDTEDEPEQSKRPESVAEIQGKEVILVVEDNPDLRSYITEKFRRMYKVIEADNGATGLSKALEEIPDLVITDLMMPVMGGVEFCLKLKEHPALNHIPVIMLTAKADKNSRIEGLEAAADDYITKPFDSDLLLVRVKNLISQRNELRKHFEKDLIISVEENHAASPHFSKLREIVKLIDTHLDDPDFDLNSMAAQLYMSRRGVFRKTRAVTGMTPHALVRIMRMKRAASLLRNKEYNVTEVMYRVGMKNPSHFARSFRKYYGINPGEYRTRETD
jgi:DNA-binding response OmpR family regulator/two-component sensor histidine kinase